MSRSVLCPCGSGKKSKHCCLNTKQSQIHPILSFAIDSQDSQVRLLIEMAKRNKSTVSTSEYWSDLGQALGSSGDHKRAKQAFSTGARIAPNDYALRLNIAVTESALGNESEALEVVNSVPDDYPRKSIIAANILRDLGRKHEAIAYYEKAIEEEPKFDLPYINLLALLDELESHLYDFWMDRALATVTKSPTIAVMYCYRLLQEMKFPELIQADWIDSLESKFGDTNIVGRNDEHPRMIVEAQLFRILGKLYISKSKNDLSKALSILDSTDRSWHLCTPARLLTEAGSNLGDIEAVRNTYSYICKGCKGDRNGVAPLDVYLARASRVSGDYEAVVLHVEKVLIENKDNQELLYDYWWSLDELGHLDEAIEVARQLYLLNPLVPNLEYNLGYLHGKAGSLGLARHFYEKASARDENNLWVNENLSLAMLLDGDMQEAQRQWENTLAKMELLVQEEENYVPLEDIADEEIPQIKLLRLKKIKWVNLTESAYASEGSPSYALDLISLNAESYPIIGSNQKVGAPSYSTSKVINALSEPQSDGAIELIHQLRKQQRGDVSPLISSLSRSVSSWGILPQEAKNALLEGERRLYEESSIDHAPDIVSFAKSVEIALRKLVFDEYAMRVNARVDIERHIQVALQDKFKKAHSFVKFVERGQHLELGSMLFVLRLCLGKTAKKLFILDRLRKYIEMDLSLSELLTTESFEDLDELTQLRNPAAHSQTFGVKEARVTRELAFRQLERFRNLSVK